MLGNTIVCAYFCHCMSSNMKYFTLDPLPMGRIDDRTQLELRIVIFTFNRNRKIRRLDLKTKFVPNYIYILTDKRNATTKIKAVLFKQ